MWSLGVQAEQIRGENNLPNLYPKGNSNLRFTSHEDHAQRKSYSIRAVTSISKTFVADPHERWTYSKSTIFCVRLCFSFPLAFLFRLVKSRFSLAMCLCAAISLSYSSLACEVASRSEGLCLAGTSWLISTLMS